MPTCEYRNYYSIRGILAANHGMVCMKDNLFFERSSFINVITLGLRTVLSYRVVSTLVLGSD